MTVMKVICLNNSCYNSCIIVKTERPDLSCCVAELKSNWFVVNANINYIACTYRHYLPLKNSFVQILLHL